MNFAKIFVVIQELQTLRLFEHFKCVSNEWQRFRSSDSPSLPVLEITGRIAIKMKKFDIIFEKFKQIDSQIN